jgi:hypothetical protein
VDVTDPSSPEEIVAGVLDDLLDEDPAMTDTDVAADNIVIALRAAGYLPEGEQQ